MAEYFVLDGSVKENHYRVAAHIAVPGGNNAAGKLWSAVAVEFQNNDTASAVPYLLPAVQTDLDAGTKYEFVMDIEVDAELADPAKLTAFEAALAAQVTVETANLQARLQYWGQEGTV
jgi:hypothetical protein